MPSELQKSLISGVAWTSVSAWVVRAIGIAYTIVVLTHLSVYEYGVTELVLSIPALFGFMNLPGLETSVMSDMAKEHAQQNKQKAKFIFTSYFSIRILLGFLAFGGLFFSTSVVEQLYNPAIATMVQVLSFSFLMSPIRSAYQIIFRVNLNFNLLAMHRVTEEVSKLVVIMIAFYVFNLGPLGVVIAYLCADLITLPIFTPIIIRFWLREYVGIGGRVGWLNPLYNLRAHGKWGIFSSYVNQFSQNIRPWVIKVMLGTHAVGIYAAAMGMYQNTAALIPVNQVVAPVIPQFIDKPKALRSLSSAVLKYQFLAYVLSAVAMLFFLPILIRLFFPEFAASYLLFSFMLIALVPVAFTGTFETIFIALKAQKDLFWANVYIVLAVITLLPVFIHFFGIWGIALEFFVTQTVYAFGRYKKLRWLMPEYSVNLGEMFSVTEKDRLIVRTIVSSVRRFI